MFPRSVELDEEQIARLEKLYKAAYAKIVGEIEGATNFGVANRKAILKQIEGILKEFGSEVNGLIEEDIPALYEDGAQLAVKQLQNVGADVKFKTGFNKIHEEAISALIDDTANAFGESMQGVNRSAQNLLGKAVREQITQQMAIGKVGGEALKEIKKTVVGTLRTEGLDSLVDKAGRGWTLDRYAEMLIRTKAVEARNRGMANRLAENDYDLVQVSSHGATDVCADWEGKILSVTGQTEGYDTVADAEADGLFHPNCKHAINVIVPELALKTRAYDTGSGSYLDSAEDELNDILGAAKKYDKTFKNKVEQIASKAGLDYKHGSVKTDDRAIEKVLSDYGLNVDKLKDANRSLLFIDDPNNMASLVQQIKQDFNVVRVKNDFENSDAGYKKAIVNVKIPGGATSEIQVTTEEYWKARKELGGHDLYEAVRVKTEGWEEMEKQMNDLYDEAAKDLEARLNSS